jgi:hypothetical protein
MFLIQILLPVYSNERTLFPEAFYEQVREELTERFGGLTAYVRSPASGHWKQTPETTVRDDIVVYEVMVEAVDAAWWATYREELRARFQQDKLIIRASALQLL